MKKTYTLIITGMLFIIVAIALFYLMYYFSTILHELGHVREAHNQGVNFTYVITPTILITKNLQVGMTYPASGKDCEKFNMLPNEKQEIVRHAGVKQEMMVFVPIFLISLWLCIKNFKQHPYIYIMFFIVALDSALIILISSLGNIFLPPCTFNNWYLNDWLARNFTNCSIYG